MGCLKHSRCRVFCVCTRVWKKHKVLFYNESWSENNWIWEACEHCCLRSKETLVPSPQTSSALLHKQWTCNETKGELKKSNQDFFSRIKSIFNLQECFSKRLQIFPSVKSTGFQRNYSVFLWSWEWLVIIMSTPLLFGETSNRWSRLCDTHLHSFCFWIPFSNFYNHPIWILLHNNIFLFQQEDHWGPKLNIRVLGDMDFSTFIPVLAVWVSYAI